MKVIPESSKPKLGSLSGHGSFSFLKMKKKNDNGIHIILFQLILVSTLTNFELNLNCI